jgi:hypothetical protein
MTKLLVRCILMTSKVRYATPIYKPSALHHHAEAVVLSLKEFAGRTSSSRYSILKSGKKRKDIV